jgi:spore maturation protein SpmA
LKPVVIIAIAFVLLIPTTVFGENVQTTLDDKKTIMIPITGATVEDSHLSTESKILSIELISRTDEVEISIPRYFRA